MKSNNLKRKPKKEVIEASLTANRTTVRVKALKGAKKMTEGKHYFPSEDDARLFVERGWAIIDDVDYKARLIKKGEEMPQPPKEEVKKRGRKAAKEEGPTQEKEEGPTQEG